LKGEFSKGKFIGKGEIFNANTSTILEFDSMKNNALSPLNQNTFKSLLKKLHIFDEIEIPLETTNFSMKLDETLYGQLTKGFMSNEETGWNSNIELEQTLNWGLVSKYMLFYKDFNINEATKLYSIDNVIMYWNITPEGICQGFVQIKCDYIAPYILLFDEKISDKNAFYFSFFSLGLFHFASKPSNKTSLYALFQNINGIKYTFPGIKELGVFSDFELQRGMKIHDFWIAETIDFTKKVYFSRINNTNTMEKYEGFKKQQIKSYQGMEIYSNGFRYEGGFDNDKPSGKGVLTDKEGKIIYKGYFLNGLPTWGLFYKEKSKKYEGVFYQNDGFFTDIQVKNIEDLVNNLNFTGVFLTPEEKIISTIGTFPLKDLFPELTGHFHLIYDTSNEYEGYLNKGVKKGSGCYKIKREGIVHISIQGLWEAHQVRAVIYWDSQNSFEKSIGNFSFNDNGNYIMEDFGLLYFKNGNKYEGLLLNNKLQGFGEFQQNVNGLSKIYKGEFSQSLRNGYGVLEDLNLETKEKTVYMGIFQKNKKSGFGILMVNDNLLMEGIFYDNSIKFGCLYLKNHPQIVKIYANLMKKTNNSNEIYVTGYGIVHLKDGKLLECEVSQICEGYMKEIKGRLIFSKVKKVYEGMLKDLKPNGKGELYKNGKLLYAGEFVDGKFHGIGKLKLCDNIEYVGEFKKGLKDGFGLEMDLFENRCVFKGYWKNGLKENRGVIRNERILNKKGFVRMKNNWINEILIDL